MPLSAEESKRRKTLLQEALVPARYNNVPLSKRGEDGRQLRDYFTSDHFKHDIRNGHGAIYVSRSPNLAASWCRDLVLGKYGAQFYYLQTFANRLETGFFGNSMPDAFVIEWFEQAGVEDQFSGRERQKLQTAMIELMDDGHRFYLFTSVHPENSTWWTKDFIRSLLECNTLLISGENDDYRNSGKRTPVGSAKKQGQEKPKTSERVRVR